MTPSIFATSGSFRQDMDLNRPSLVVATSGRRTSTSWLGTVHSPEGPL